MNNEKSKSNLFICLFLLGNFLFSYPILTLFNIKTIVLGIPVFFFYMFSAWVGLIILMIVCTESRYKNDDPQQKPPHRQSGPLT